MRGLLATHDESVCDPPCCIHSPDLVPAGVYVVVTKAVADATRDQPIRTTVIQLAERPLLEIARRRATK